MSAIPPKVEGFNLPDTWRRKRIKYVATYNDEALSEATDEFKEIEYIEISGVSLVDGVKSTSILQFHEAPSRARRIVREGDTLVSTVRTYLKAIATVRDAPDNLIASTGFCVIRAGEEIDPAFLGWAMKSEPLVGEIVARSVGVSYPATNASEVVKLEVPLPDLDTQKRIARYLDEKTARIDALIDTKQTLLDRLAEKRQALITRAVTRGLDPAAPLKDSGSDWLGEVPQHWDVRPLKWRVRIQSGQVDPVADEYKDLPLIAPDHIQQRTGRIIEVRTADEQSAMSGKYLCAPTAVLYSKIRPALRKAAVFGQDCLCSADMYALNPGEEVERDFLFFFLLTEAFSAYAELSSLRVAMPKVNREALGSVEICIPPVEEQRAIASYCNAENEKHLTAIDEVAKSVDRLIEYRAALITAAVTGKVEALLTEDASKSAKKEAPAPFKRAVLATHIADTLCDHPTFGRVKFQKLLHLCEAHLEIQEVAGNYHRDAAGPFDTQMMRSVHSQIAKQGWIVTQKREGGKGTLYRRGAKIEGHREYFDRYFGDRKNAVDDLLILLKTADTQQAEIVSTAFAAWNDLLIEGKSPTDDEIVGLILNDWTESKKQISADRWHTALDWMREKGLVPRGLGEHTKKKRA